MGVEEDIDEGGGNGWQCLRVQCENTKAVLWTLDGMHCGARPCKGGIRQRVEGEKQAMGWGAPWWPAREESGLSIESSTGTCLGIPSPISLSCKAVILS